MKNFFYALLIVSVVIASLFIVLNWSLIMAWWNRPKDGDKCIFASEPAYIKGVIKNGKCTLPSMEPNQANTPTQPNNTLEVTNPAGASLYYQSPLESGGLIYSKSNIVLPIGTKLVWVKTWPDTVEFNKFYYETTYKYAGRTGFFRAEDIKKIN